MRVSGRLRLVRLVYFGTAVRAERGCNMRMRYEAPRVMVVGSMRDLTKANSFGSTPDNLTALTVFGISVPGDNNPNTPGPFS